MKPIIDASIFLGMNHVDEGIRKLCVDIIIKNISTGLEINLEQIGLCDKVIWDRSRHEQDLYYPFMDYLHTVMPFDRVSYTDEAYYVGPTDTRFNHLPVLQSILAAHTVLKDIPLITLDKKLINTYSLRDNVVILSQDKISALEFPTPLNTLYLDSLNLLLNSNEVGND